MCGMRWLQVVFATYSIHAPILSAQVRYKAGCMKGVGPYAQWCVADPNNFLAGSGAYWFLVNATRTKLLAGASAL